MAKSKMSTKKKFKKKTNPFLKKARGNSSGNTPESKYLDNEISGVVAQFAGSIISQSLNLIQQGVTDDGRIGREVTLQKVQIKGHMHMKTFNYVPAQHYVRFIVYLDTQCNGTVPTIDQIINDASVNALPMAGFYNLDEIERFVILKDEIIRPETVSGYFNTIAPQNVPVETITPFNYNINNLNVPLNFTGSGATLPDVRNNNIGILAFSSDPASNVNQLDFQTRIRYKDN